ncbi:MAG: sugar kinase [Actinobacteria bacterium]|nr:sugar kinase [Actinomycetota bacterium]
MGIIVVGTVALDDVKTPFGEAKEALGGSATYFSLAASFFTDVAIVAVVGRDFPPEHLQYLEERGIDTSAVSVLEGETFRWSGEYGYDLNERETLDTRLNVLEEFDPKIPDRLVGAELVFLANIDPMLQLSVLDQVENPRLTACDTMNFWIEGKRLELLEMISRVDIMVLNDSECRQLADEPNLIKATRRIREMGGPETLIVKKGEHGALLFTGETVFSAPAYPLESVFDPTGAGDSFAGGFMGYLAKSGETGDSVIRQAVMYGTVMASYCVEQFSVERMSSLTWDDIRKRYEELRELTRF